MSGNLKMFEEIEQKIQFGFKMLTVSVTKGRPRDCFAILAIFISQIVIFPALIYHVVSISNGSYITNNIMMGLFFISGFTQVLLKNISGLSVDFGVIEELLQWIRSLYEEINEDSNVRLIIHRKLRIITDIWKLAFKIATVIVFLSVTSLCITNMFKGEMGIVLKIPYFSRDFPFYFPIMHFLQYSFLYLAAFNVIYSDLSLVFLALAILGAVNITNEIIVSHQNDIHTAKSFLNTITERHCDITTNMKRLQKVLFLISFTHFLSSTLVLLLLFSFIRTNNDSTMAIIVFFFVFGELFMLCFFGQIIQSKMQKLSEDLYLTNWYDLEQKDQKRFLIILGMMQRSYALKAVGMYDINLQTFIQITKLATSYCAILLTFTK